jgi:TonB family protein
MIKTFSLLFFITISLSAHCQNYGVEKFSRNGSKAYEAGNYQEAVSNFTHALELDKTGSTATYFNRAAAYYYLGDTCNFCLDLLHIMTNDFEAKKLYNEKCKLQVIDFHLNDSVIEKFPNVKYIRKEYAKCTPDTVLYYVYDNDGVDYSTINLAETTDKTNNIPETDFSNNSDPIFTIVEEMPTYPGGEKARSKFLADNVKYPELAMQYHIQGCVYITFIVDPTGTVRNVKVLRGIGGGCDEEAVRVLNLMPKWIPGKQSGKKVSVLFNMPLCFHLQGKTK